MATQKTPHHNTYVYNEINIGKNTSTKHYKFNGLIESNDILTNLLNISKNRFYANSNPIYWAKTRKNNKWQTPCLTGLFKTEKCNIFIGDVDINKVKTHTLVFVFSNNATTLTIYFFKNYYTRNLNDIIQLINL